ncbi:2-hydroxychromene-2-carboxylate isomerase [Polyangium aurulentum]|uniref:2-hydroxychromene-2-carboxylate isomerase n=1 Tax=Polyangium aurulentum TaxID=2567896 RepID=UPI0010ADC996|nr:2-hydroxychromene-2-carboxylate isomerase [Polyangium aurulentum]UQA56700.1 2-hydroxychromene-2-carboxylate isomerase [Polyangium aurulentum]
MKTIDFFFDFSSPYSYLAATQLPGVAARTGARVAYRPIVLFGVFKATGNDMPAKVAAKGMYMAKDLERWARHYGVPFKFSSHFPSNTIKAMRLVLVADEGGRGEAAALAGFRAMWEEDRDLNDAGVLADLARAAGLDPEAALAAIETPAIKDKLRANTDEAVARGAFGAPAMFVGEQLFWGNDRIHFVEEAARG